MSRSTNVISATQTLPDRSSSRIRTRLADEADRIEKARSKIMRGQEHQPLNMQSIIVVAKNKKTREDYAIKICEDLEIGIFDITVIDSNLTPQLKQSKTIGIEEIRKLQSKIFLKPVNSKNKAIIFNNSEDLTMAAQNALLKVLEEPPEDTIIILVIPSRDLLIPTILSRCKVIKIKEENKFFSEKEIDQNLKTLTSLLSSRVGERLKIAQDNGKTKEESLIFLEKIILAIRQELLKRIDDSSKNQTFNSNPEQSRRTSLNLKDLLISFNKTHAIIKTTNVSPRFALENLLSNQ